MPVSGKVLKGSQAAIYGVRGANGVISIDVNIGYGTVKQRDLLTNVSKIDGKDTKYESYRTIYDMLKGKPGVQVNGTSIKIQGASSFQSGTEPLLVVDGVVVSTLDDIQPNMVKSIQVLKGSSASMYGSRGFGGVVLISTRIKNK